MGRGATPAAGGHGCLPFPATGSNGRADWLGAGQGLPRVPLEVTRPGSVAGISARLTEVPRIGETLRRDPDLPGHPQLLLQLGHAAKASPPLPADPGPRS